MQDLKKALADIRWAGAQGIIGDAQNDALTAIAEIRKDHGQATLEDERDSNNAVRALMSPGHVLAVFYLPPDDQQSEGMSFLKYTREDLDPQGPNSTYDWRLGVPVLMQLIKYRLVVLAAYHPKFRYARLLQIGIGQIALLQFGPETRPLSLRLFG